jgi:hypothetical protein
MSSERPIDNQHAIRSLRLMAAHLPTSPDPRKPAAPAVASLLWIFDQGSHDVLDPQSKSNNRVDDG